MSTPQEMWEAMPPLTKTWLGFSVASTALVAMGTLDPTKMLFYPPLVYQNFEIWRLVSNFLFFGKFSFGFLMQMFILVRFSTSVELEPYKTSRVGGSADYAFALLIMGTCCLIIGAFMGMYFMGPPLIFAVLYLWSRLHPEDPTNIWGFRFAGKHLPWALMAFTILTGGSPVSDVIGVIVGHAYYFLVDVLPRMKGGPIVQTPELFISMIHRATAQPYVQPGGATTTANTGFRGHSWGQGRRLGAANN